MKLPNTPDVSTIDCCRIRDTKIKFKVVSKHLRLVVNSIVDVKIEIILIVHVKKFEWGSIYNEEGLNITTGEDKHGCDVCLFWL